MASTTSVPGGKQPCSGSLWPPGRAPRPTADGIVCVLQNRPASADSRVRFTAVAVDAGARVAAGDERGALVVVDAARNRFERVATLDARATALAWVGDRVACAVCHPRAPRLVAVDAATGTLSEVAAAHAPGTSIATLDARDRLVVTAARDAARFWTLDGDWLRQSAFEGAGAEVAAAAVGTDGNAVVLDRDGVVHLVDSSSGQATAQLSPQHGEAPSRGVWCCLAALPGGAVVAGGPLLCEWAPGGAFERLSAPPPRARSVVALLRAGSDLLALGEDGRLNALDVSQPSAAAATLAVAPRAVVVAAAAAGASVAVATADGELLLLDLAVARRRQPVGPTPLRRYFPAPEPAAPEPAPAPAPAPWDFKGPPALPPPPRPRRAAPRRGAPLHRVARPCDADALTPARLRRVLGEEGEFPAEHRSLAWRALLDLPERQAAFDALRCGDGGQGAAVDAAARAAAACRRRAAKLPRSNAATALVECCGALGRWCPALADADWLPAAVYPFALAFEGDALCTFETVVCLLGKWARGWLACWPEPPLPALNAVERLLQNYDAEVAAHLGALGCTPTDWAWPVLRSFLSRRARKSEDFRGLRLKQRGHGNSVPNSGSRAGRSACGRRTGSGSGTTFWRGPTGPTGSCSRPSPSRPRRGARCSRPRASTTSSASSGRPWPAAVRSGPSCGRSRGGARRTRCSRASRGPSPTARRRRARRRWRAASPASPAPRTWPTIGFPCRCRGATRSPPVHKSNGRDASPDSLFFYLRTGRRVSEARLRAAAGDGHRPRGVPPSRRRARRLPRPAPRRERRGAGRRGRGGGREEAPGRPGGGRARRGGRPGAPTGRGRRGPVHKSNCRDASPPRLNHDLHAIDATPAQWRTRLMV